MAKVKRCKENSKKRTAKKERRRKRGEKTIKTVLRGLIP
jgi:hypothetical protein